MLKYLKGRKWPELFASALVLGLAVMIFHVEPRLLRQLRLTVFDTFMSLKPRPFDDAAATPVRIVDIDDESLSRLGQWPWPRDRMADLVRALRAAGAAVIAFDVVFAEPDRTSPGAVAEHLPPEMEDREALAGVLAALPDHDKLFAEAMKEGDGGAGQVVLGFSLTDLDAGETTRNKASIVSVGPDPLPWLIRKRGLVTNLRPFERAAQGNGAFTMEPDQDGVVRRVPLAIAVVSERISEATGETRLPRMYPALSTEVLRLLAGTRTITIASSDRYAGKDSTGQVIISHVDIEDRVIPTDEFGRILVYYSGHRADRYIPAWKVLDGSADTDRLKGAVVFIGTSAAGLLDLRASPLDRVLPGVEVHAEIVEQALEGAFLKRSQETENLEFITMLVLGILMMVMLPRLGALYSALATVLAVVALLGISWMVFLKDGLLLDPVYPGFVLIAVYGAGTLVGYMREEQEKKQVRTAFAHYLAPAMVEELANNPGKLKLGGEIRDMTLLFSDIRGFTTISEQFEPEELVQLINDFLTPMTGIVMDRRGTIDKYMGDAMMAFWNAPLDDADHAAHACDAALALISALDPINAELKSRAEETGRKYMPLLVGAGVNSGPCCVGNMGSAQRFDYSVLGDTVNLASRLEGQTKDYGVDIVIGDGTRSRAPDFAALEIDRIRVKGKKEPVTIHTLLGRPDMAETAEFREAAAQHVAFLAAYRGQEWDKAEALCIAGKAVLNRKLNNLYDMYLARIAAYRAEPPGEAWDGVYVATSK